MKVTSPAGELDVIIKGTTVEGEAVVLDAEVGVWEIRVLLGPRDFRFFVSLLFRTDVLLFLIRRLFSSSDDRSKRLR